RPPSSPARPRDRPPLFALLHRTSRASWWWRTNGRMMGSMTADLTALAAELPDGALLTDPDIVAGYRHDWAADPNAGTPLAVVRATCTEDVQAVLRWATAHRVPVVPRGAGSGLSGGSSAVDGGIVLSTERMRAIDVDPVTRTAVVQPG